MIRLGLISAATYGYMGAARTPGSWHGTAFASTFNGFDEVEKDRYEWTFAPSGKRIDKARVVRIWDPSREWAEALARVCDIPRVCNDPTDCTQGVDAVIVVDDGSGEHWRYAAAPLEKGIPTFCDKPLAMNTHDAQQIAGIAARAGTPFMSASSLRFVPGIVALKDGLREIGDVHMATVACANDLVYYGIHALSMAYAVLGRGAVSALHVGRPGRNLVRVRFSGGHDIVMIVGEQPYMHAGFRISLYGSNGWRTVEPDMKDCYAYLLEQFVALVDNGRVSVPIDEEVELIAALEAGKLSLQERREVSVSELLRAR